MTGPPHNVEQIHNERWELLTRINRLTDWPLIGLSFVWLLLLILDFTQGLSPLLQTVSTVIWIVFIGDFALEFVIAPQKLRYLRQNWLTVLSLALPALRVLRVARVARVLRAGRAIRSLSLVRLLTSLNRGMRALSRTMGRRGLGYVVVLTLIVTFAGAAGMLLFERPQALQEAGLDPSQVGGLPTYSEAVWWTAMLMTTMGSEYWPRTPEGRLLGWLLALYAFTVFGYITATIASHFIGQDRAAGEAEQQVTSAELAALRQEIAALRTDLASQADRHDPSIFTE